MSTIPSLTREDIAPVQWRALLVGVVAMAICVIGAPFSPHQFYRAYLATYLYCVGLGLGCLAVLMLYHLTGGAWGFLIRRILEAGARTLPLLALMFVPIACGLGFLYTWAQPGTVAASKDLQYKQVYLNTPFVLGRTFGFFFIWSVIAYLLSVWSRAEDRAGDFVPLVRRQGRLSSVGLIVYGVSITFASVDWLMSLQPSFHSTIFGPVFAVGEMLSGLALAIIVLAWLADRPALADRLSAGALNDLGNLLLTILVIWAYVVWFQFMLIWMANIPYEVAWYHPRSNFGWQWVAWTLFLFHFLVPFFLLLMRDIKRRLRSLAEVAALILFMQLVYSYYQVMPAFTAPRMAEHWMDFLMPLGLGGLWLAYMAYELRRYPLLPAHDPNAEAAAELRAHDEEMEAAQREEVSHA